VSGFDHPPVRSAEQESPQTAARNARYGMILFVAYLLLYAGFMLLNAFQPAVMDAIPFAGINLAIVYGFGLIGAALLLALVYGWICRSPAPLTPTPLPQGERGKENIPLARRQRGEGREERA